MVTKRTFEDGCMSKAQVCEYLGISLATLDREIKKNSIKSLTIGSRRLFTRQWSMIIWPQKWEPDRWLTTRQPSATGA